MTMANRFGLARFLEKPCLLTRELLQGLLGISLMN
jgi:hypothetical protein